MANGGQRVLLVDDDEAIRLVCGDTLRHEGYAVTLAASGQEALQAFAEGTYDAAVVDLVLPDIDGLSLLGAFREADPDVVVILMTGHATLESAIAAVRRGAYDFLRKPFSALDLLRVVGRGLQQRQLALQNRGLVQELDRMNQDLRHQVGVVTDELTAFLNLGRRLSAAEGPLPVLHEVLRAARQLTTAGSGAILQLLPEGVFCCLAADGEAATDLRRLEGEASDGLLRRCLASQRPALYPELLADPETARGPFALLGLSAAMVLPLLAGGVCVGVLALFDPATPFNDRQAALTRVLVVPAAEVLAQATLRGPVPTGATDEFVDLQDILSARRQP